MISKLLEWYTKHARAIENGFALMFVALFVCAVLDWLGLLPGDPGFQPLKMLLLSSALLAQGVAIIVRRHSQQAFYALLAASLVMLAATFFVAS